MARVDDVGMNLDARHGTPTPGYGGCVRIAEAGCGGTDSGTIAQRRSAIIGGVQVGYDTNNVVRDSTPAGVAACHSTG